MTSTAPLPTGPGGGTPPLGALPAAGEPWCRIRRFEGVDLCFVDLDAFADAVLVPISAGPRPGPGPQPLPPEAFRAPFLGAADSAQVNAFKSFKKQREWMAGRLALGRLLTAAGLPTPDPREPLVTYGPRGAPRVTAHPELPISISHSHQWAVAGLAAAGGAPIGLDLERLPAGDLRYLVNTAFSPRERKDLPDDPRVVVRHWTIKEAYLKFLGLGFHESLQRVEILAGRLCHDGRPVEGLRLHTEYPWPDYALALVTPAGPSGARGRPPASRSPAPQI
jgi:4'-phosphopantetheinyl transferase